MKKLLKGLLKVAGAIVLLLVAAGVGVYFYAFGSNRPIPDGEQLSPTSRLVKDGFVDFAVLDLENGKLALIDAGNQANGKAISAELQRRQLGPDAVAAIFLTHGHSDHVNGCYAFPHAEVYALATEVDLIEGRTAAMKIAPKNPPGLHVTHPMQDGEIVTLGNRHIQVFATPGHTPGSAVYLADGVLYFGDSAGGDKDGHLKAAVSLFSSDAAQNVASLKALATRLTPMKSTIKELSFAHTGPLPTLDPLLDFAAAH